MRNAYDYNGRRPVGEIEKDIRRHIEVIFYLV